MLLAIAAIVVGLVLLVWSADKFVDGSVGLAEGFGMSKVMIGLTIVSLGTSAPEIFVSITAALENASELALGNALGSNIANIGLVLGVTALVAALPVKQGLLKQDLPALLAVTAICGFLLHDLVLNTDDGLTLMVVLVILMYLMFRYKTEHPEESIETANIDEEIPDYGTKESIISFTIGLVVLIISSRLLVWGAVDIATSLGVSEVVIGLTIVAIGTSLPEMAASIASALRNHHDIALGNIIGSNILNLLAVLSVASVIYPIEITQEIFIRDYGAMVLFTLALTLFVLIPKKRKQLSKVEGIILLTGYIAYMYTLYLRSIA
ncbi:MAG: calcium/sodium antiporter [Gammaproteobacteria bacterium]|nr:MAG: calcium/sodium antiporter [Gammaproteobacteria bacterium]